jgi:hypothetical protein
MAYDKHSGAAKVARSFAYNATGVIIKNSPGTVFGVEIHNQIATIRYVKHYNKATAATKADTPVTTITVAASGTKQVMLPFGIDFSAGIGVRAVTGLADTDNTGATANDLNVNIFWK